MCEDFINASEMEEFKTSIAKGASNANSLIEFAEWLQSLQCLESVELEEYVVKTFPPRREFTIGLRLEGGEIEEMVLTIAVTQDGQLKFLEMRELG